MKKEIDPITGLLERSVNIADILNSKDIPSWARPKGPNIF
jgi:hypothetical protein